MSDMENARAHHGALKTAATTTSASRARLWAGFNRYLAAESEHAQKAADAEHESGKAGWVT